jgi:hypothetical protein
LRGSNLLTSGFVALSLAMAGLFVSAVYWVRRGKGNAVRSSMIAAVGAAAWLGITYVAAAKGWISFTTAPPTFIFLFIAVFALSFGLGFSPLGRELAVGLPLAALVGYQSFRILVELLMHRAYEEGLMPVQMSYSGRNFDILTGLSALVIAVVHVFRPLPRWVFVAWNVAGAALLLNILTIAILSTPLPIRAFHNEPANVWVTHAPWVWLPAAMVVPAITGHLLLYRRLRAG